MRHVLRIGLTCTLLLVATLVHALEDIQCTNGTSLPPWRVRYKRPPLPLDPSLPQPDAFPFAIAAPFGSVTLATADCCPFSNFPLPLPPLRKRPRMVFLLGAQKAGTTALYQLLTLHPQVATWRRKKVSTTNPMDVLFLNKEAHFMARPAGITYADVKDYLSGWDSAPDDAVWLDATPGYMHLPVVACRLKAAFPDARLIISLRDPILRAMSQFQHEGRMEWNVNNTQVPFAERVKRELDLLSRKGCRFHEQDRDLTWNRCFKCYMSELCQPWSVLHHGKDRLCDTCPAGARCDNLNWMLMKGMFGPIIANWLRLFPSEQMFVVNMHDQINQLPEIFKFLGLSEISLTGDVTQAALDKIKSHSAEHFGASACTSIERVGAEAGALLKEFYDGQNRVFYQLMNMMGLNFMKFKDTCTVGATAASG